MREPWTYSRYFLTADELFCILKPNPFAMRHHARSVALNLEKAFDVSLAVEP